MLSKRKLEIERLADTFRKTSDVSSYGITNIFDLCNNSLWLGHHCYLIRYPLGASAMLGAVQYRDEDYIIFSNSSVILSREIFTVAHEIGHIVLEHVGPDTREIQDRHLDSIDEAETEANYFAACLLMPKDKLKEFIDLQFQKNSGFSILEVAAIMSTFNVSFETAVNRLESLGIISGEKHDELMQKKSDTTVTRMLRAIGVAPTLCAPQNIKSIPIEFLQWVRYNYQHHLIPIETLKKATDYLDDVSIEDFEIDSPDEDDAFDLEAFLEEEDA